MSLITGIPQHVEPADATVSRLITIHRRAPVTPFQAVASGAPVELSLPEDGPATPGPAAMTRLTMRLPDREGVAER